MSLAGFPEQWYKTWVVTNRGGSEFAWIVRLLVGSMTNKALRQRSNSGANVLHLAAGIVNKRFMDCAIPEMEIKLGREAARYLRYEICGAQGRDGGR